MPNGAPGSPKATTFGILSVNGLLGEAPATVPTHFTGDGDQLLIHLGRPNPVWHTLQ